jgi:programmed cell death protein 4
MIYGLLPCHELEFSSFKLGVMNSVLFLGGAGGKGTWGKLGCELELPWVDPNDPNYESEPEESKVTKIKTLVPEMGEEDVRKAVEPLILEFFENNDAMEVS